jgi:cytochrome c peroxidase
MSRRLWLVYGALVFIVGPAAAADGDRSGPKGNLDWQVPNQEWKLAFADERPIRFVNANLEPEVWKALANYWNETTENVVNPITGKEIERKAVLIKVPLGLTQNPPVPVENPMTVAKWKLGKQLYFDTILSSDSTVSCATCHDPARGFTDQSPFSTGIANLRGGMSAPTVLNSAYNLLQFWDGRAGSLEDQAQGPVENPVEMFAGDGHAWNKAILRIRQKPAYVAQFRQVFGCDPTRDTVAKAIAAYERTVLSGNAIHDRADQARKVRIVEEESDELDIIPKDYEKVLTEAFTNKDSSALEALGLDVEKDAGKAGEFAKRIDNGRKIFFGKARCNACHVGDNWTDNQFHNLGVGVKDGNVPDDLLGRFGAQPTGAKNPDLIGAFKTPTLRGLLGTAPYMHDGSEQTLEKVVDLYDKGGNANRFLDIKMRDEPAERAYLASTQNGTPYKGPEVHLLGVDSKPIVPLKLNLQPKEKQDLILFLRALQGDPPDPIVADRNVMPK